MCSNRTAEVSRLVIRWSRRSGSRYACGITRSATIRSIRRAYEAIGFDELRALAENHDITRLAIETRKDQIEKLEWTIKCRNEKSAGADAASRIDRLTEFWRSPDGEQPFATWLREALEDVLVLDAATFELRRNAAAMSSDWI
jgi:hypothetical protein